MFGPLQHVESRACANRLQIEGANNTLWRVDEFSRCLGCYSLIDNGTVREG